MSSAAPRRAAAAAQPNGTTGVDHVVVATPDLARTLAALAAAGLSVRRTRAAGPAAQQAFFVIGDAVLEVVGPTTAVAPGETLALGPLGSLRGGDRARFWGLTVVCPDLEAARAATGPDRLGPARPAVQPGRTIATIAAAAGLSTRLAFMTPR